MPRGASPPAWPAATASRPALPNGTRIASRNGTSGPWAGRSGSKGRVRASIGHEPEEGGDDPGVEQTLGRGFYPAERLRSLEAPAIRALRRQGVVDIGHRHDTRAERNGSAREPRRVDRKSVV